MKVNASHNDNIRLVESGKTAVREIEAAPTLTFGANTETTKFEFDSLFSFKRFDKSEFNSDDQYLTLTFSHEFERSTVGLGAKLVHDSTITSELLTTGRIGDTAVHAEHYELTPSWTYTLNESNLLKLAATYATQNYDSNAYIGYDNPSGEVDWIHVFNDRFKWVTSATYSDYRSDTLSTFAIPGPTWPSSSGITTGQFGEQSYSIRTKTTGLQIGVDYLITEQSTLSARLGRSRNDTTYPIKDPNNVCSNAEYLQLISNPQYLQLVQLGLLPAVGGICNSIPHDVQVVASNELDWSWQSERQNIAIRASQSTQPTANGYTVEALQVNSNWGYQLTEFDSASASLVLVRNRASGSTAQLPIAASADRNYAAATLAYQRQLNQDWYVTANYQFSYQKYTQTDYRADSHAILLGIEYRPTQWHWSR